MRALLIPLVLLASACTTKPPDAVCPEIVPYSAADQRALAGEIETHPDLVQTPRFIGDYIGLRDQVRACWRD